MDYICQKLQNAKNFIEEKINFKPKIGLVLGSGLGNLINNMEIKLEISYSEIDGFPISTVEGHTGKYIFGYLKEIPIICMNGRVHYYEGYDITDVVMPVRLMAMLGIETLILTNSAGGIQDGMKAGDLMLITDHISSFILNPLIGKNNNQLGIRFPDMSEVYDLELRNLILRQAEKNSINLKSGTYVQLTGPSFETPAEIRMLEVLGADAVGMSTAVEVIAARHMGVRVCGISLISNLAAGKSKTFLSYEEVEETASGVINKFEKLLLDTVEAIGGIR